MAVSKEWHHSLTEELRNSSVNKLIQAVSACNSNDTTMSQVKAEYEMFIVTKLKDMENKYYNQANTRSEYYYLIADAVYTIKGIMSTTLERCDVGETTTMEPSFRAGNQMQEEIVDLGKQLDHLSFLKNTE